MIAHGVRERLITVTVAHDPATTISILTTSVVREHVHYARGSELRRNATTQLLPDGIDHCRLNADPDRSSGLWTPCRSDSTMRVMKKFLLGLIAVVGLSLLPVAANATNGYVCEVQEYNYSGFGNYGGILVSFYSGKNCTGSVQGVMYACTTGSTDPVCTSSSYYTYTADQLLAIYGNFIAHARSGNMVRWYTTTSCQSGGTSCLDAFYFRGN
jgi:hypothetical protein